MKLRDEISSSGRFIDLPSGKSLLYQNVYDLTLCNYLVLINFLRSSARVALRNETI